MRDTYSYFRDPRALAEIRKHKWIESQKAEREVGFATAAVDWIKRYGLKWKEIHAAEIKDTEIFLERRHYRRFEVSGNLELIKYDISILAKPVDLSFFGVTCRAQEFLPLGSRVEARMLLRLGNDKRQLDCYGVIERALALDSQSYELFFKFDEDCQKKLAKPVLSHL